MTLSKKPDNFVAIEPVTVGADVSRLSTTIFAVLCSMPIVSALLFGGVDSATWVLLTVCWTAVLLLWLAESYRSGGLVINYHPVILPIAGLIVIGLIQLMPLGSSIPGMEGASRALSLDPYATRLFLVKLAVYLIFFAGALTFINTRRRLRTIVLLIIVFGACIAFFGILQRLANPDGIYGLRAAPQAIPFGPFVNQHHFAAFMQMTAGVAFGLLFDRDSGREKRILLAIAIITMGTAAVLTSSRGGLLGFVATMVFAGLFSFVRRRDGDRGRTPVALIAAGGVALIIVIFGVALFVGGNDALLRSIGVNNDNVDVSSGRFQFWGVAWQIFVDHPIIGAGLDAFGNAFTRYDTWPGMFRVEQAHNDYLQMLADGGLLGLACIAVYVYQLYRSGSSHLNAADGFRRSAAIGALAGCSGVLTHSFFDFPLRTPSNAFFFLLLSAIAVINVGPRQTRGST